MWSRVPLLLTLIFTLGSAYSFYSQEEFDRLSADVEQRFFKAHSEFVETGVMSKELTAFYREFRFPDHLRYKEISEYPEDFSLVACLTCRSTVSTFLSYLRVFNKTLDEVESLAVGVCNGLNIYSDRLCEDLVHLMAPIMFYIQEENPDLSSYDICAVVYQSEGCGAPRSERLRFEIDIEGEPPKMKDHKGASKDSGEYYKIVHLTDIHFDPGYEVGKNSVCDEPMCCRRDQGEPRTSEEAAGRWGDYRNCDLPWDTVEKSIQSIAKVHSDADFVYFTGDAVDHSVWSTSKPYNLLLLEKIFDLMKVEFKNAKVLPTIGNHEAHPVNIFAPPGMPEPEFAIDYLFDYLSVTWSHWLPLTSLKSVQDAGRYTFLLAPGFRIVAINNNLGYTFNFWLMHSVEYLREHLQWLHDVLLEAETNKEKVHILLHIPNGGGDTYRYWSREYSRIVDRFHRIITGQFCGHTHRNELHMFYDRKDAQYATSVAFNGGSLTTFSYVNPNYVVYYVDKTSFEVIDQDFYYVNLTNANLHPHREPQWNYLYSFKDLWQVPDMSPKSINSLVERWTEDKDGLKRYWQLKGKDADPHLASGCGTSCLNNQICRIVTTEFGDDRRCKSLGV